jgi:hypothetical protein
MLCIESVLAQTHTPEESIGYEMLVASYALHLTRVTISKLVRSNNPHSGDFLWRQKFIYRELITLPIKDWNKSVSLHKIVVI